MALWSLYIDDSGTHPESPVAIAGCFLSDLRRWKDFQGEWEEAKSHPKDGFTEFHMAEFAARSYEFLTWPDDKCERVINKLIGIIERNVLAGFVSAVVKDDYDKFVTGKLREKVGEYHYTFAVQSCLDLMEQWFYASTIEHGGVHYFFDRMSKGKSKAEIKKLMQSLFEDPRLSKRFGLADGGWAFENKLYFLPLQAADILAWNGYRYMLNCQMPSLSGDPERSPHPSFIELLGRMGNAIRTRYFDRKSLSGVAAMMQRHYDTVGWDWPRGGFAPVK